MVRVCLACCCLVGMFAVDASAQLRGRFVKREPNGYQLHYTPIPPKEKETRPDAKPEDRPVKRHPVSLVTSAAPSPDYLAELEALRKASDVEWQRRIEEAKKQHAEWQREQIIAHSEWMREQPRLASIYKESRAAAQARHEAAWGFAQQAIVYDAQLRALYPSQVIVQPYDPLSAYWGIYVSGSRPR
jgi:hypothetical protein